MRLQLNNLFFVRFVYRISIGLIAVWSLCAVAPLVADSDPFFLQVIQRDTDRIEQISPTDYLSLSDAHNTRGESYLLLNEHLYALEDFLTAYEYALLGTGKDQPISALRGLFGAFLVYARMENLEKVQSLVEPLSALIHECADCECTRHYESPFVAHPCSSSREQERKDYPLLGPDHISREECQDHVEQTADALRRMLWQVKQETIRSLATAMINRLASTAIRCCRAGNAWKGCLQRLTNKYHYWKLLGVPSQTGYYREED